MEILPVVIVAVVALGASALTLFSGFGLGTLLLPAFALFFPLPTAVALTAVVHLLNNLFKLGLVGRHADRAIVLRFGLPALGAAAVGALLLGTLADLPPVTTWTAFGLTRQVRPVALVVSALMILFAVLELLPAFNRASTDARWLPLGGFISGFMGGVSGHQGALRSAFLLRFKKVLTKETFIGTNVVIAVLVDVARLTAYGGYLTWTGAFERPGVLVAAVLAAFTGAFVGARRMAKVTMRTVRLIVAILLILLGLLLGSGLLGG